MTPPRRPQTQTERDEQSFAARKEREERARESAPVFVEEECTGKYEGEELAEKRAGQSIERRVGKLETKADKTNDSLIRLETKVDTVVELLTGKAVEEGKTQRTKISTNGKVMIAVAVAAIGAISTVLVAVLS